MSQLSDLLRKYLASGACPPEDQGGIIELLGHPQGMEIAAAEVLRQLEESARGRALADDPAPPPGPAMRDLSPARKEGC